MGRNAQTLHGPQAKRRVNQVSNGLSLATSNETTLASGISHQPCVSVATMAVYSTQVSHGVLSCSFLPYTNAPLGLPNRGWHGLMKVFLLTFVTNKESTSNLDSSTRWMCLVRTGNPKSHTAFFQSHRRANSNRGQD